MTSGKIPSAPKADPLEEKVEELERWVKSQSGYLLDLKQATEARNTQSKTPAEFAAASFIIKLKELPVMYCAENINELQKQILDIIGHDFELLDRFIIPKITSRFPVQ